MITEILPQILELSLPTRERGLKYILPSALTAMSQVAPYAGAWIEILQSRIPCTAARVAPYAGAWIEIQK